MDEIAVLKLPTGWLVVGGIVSAAVIYYGWTTKERSMPVVMLAITIAIACVPQILYWWKMRYEYVPAGIFAFVAWAAVASGVRHFLIGLVHPDDLEELQNYK